METKKRFNYKEAVDKKKKFLRYREGSEIYSMGIIKFQEIAKKAFSELGGKLPKIKELNAEYAQILAVKKKAYSEYHQAKKDMQDYVTAKHNIDMILGESQREEQEQKKQKQKESTR